MPSKLEVIPSLCHEEGVDRMASFFSDHEVLTIGVGLLDTFVISLRLPCFSLIMFDVGPVRAP